MSTHAPDDLLVAAADGTLTAGQRDLLEAHLATCPRCRDEVVLAGGARVALGALPGELTPPIDVAAAVAATLAAPGGSTEASRAAAPARHTAAAPRWYRAAGLVAAAAAIALAVLVVPDLTKDDGSRDTTTAVGVAPQEAGLSGTGEDVGATGSGAPAVEVVSTDFDHGSLAALVEETRRATPSPSAAGETSAPTVAAPPGDDALACLRAGAGSQIAADARVERLLAATFEETPAYVGVVVTGPTNDPVDIRVVAVATDGCRLLDSA